MPLVTVMALDTALHHVAVKHYIMSLSEDNKDRKWIALHNSEPNHTLTTDNINPNHIDTPDNTLAHVRFDLRRILTITWENAVVVVGTNK